MVPLYSTYQAYALRRALSPFPSLFQTQSLYEWLKHELSALGLQRQREISQGAAKMMWTIRTAVRASPRGSQYSRSID